MYDIIDIRKEMETGSLDKALLMLRIFSLENNLEFPFKWSSSELYGYYEPLDGEDELPWWRFCSVVWIDQNNRVIGGIYKSRKKTRYEHNPERDSSWVYWGIKDIENQINNDIPEGEFKIPPPEGQEDKIKFGMVHRDSFYRNIREAGIHLLSDISSQFKDNKANSLFYPKYENVLETIFNFGRIFERLPSTYLKKGEEDLRDHILIHLEPRFEGSATGETFNKSGKTDILIRHKNKNVFVAECKFWSGPKVYLDTITQLLGYLTWRDSNTAIVIFVKNKNFSSVLDAVKKITPSHPNYLSLVNEQEEAWFNYHFHINDDTSRKIKLAVLLFHLP